MPRSLSLRLWPLGVFALLPSCDGLASPEAQYPIEARRIDTTITNTLPEFASPPELDQPIVQLHGRRSYIFESLAVHPWFIVWDPTVGSWETWDVYAMSGPTRERSEHEITIPSVPEDLTFPVLNERIGYIDHNHGPLKPQTRTLLGEWESEDAQAIIDVLRRPEDYPYVDTYHYWPGPNSNTYAAWVMREAGVPIDLHPMQVGKDYLWYGGFGLWFTNTFTGIQIETPIAGAKVGLLDGIEAHVLALTLGVDTWPLALKTPWGRFGWPE